MHVGLENKSQKVRVYHGVLCHHSLAFKKTFKNDPNDELSLPNTDPAIFDIVRYWMYTGRFWDPKSSKDEKIPL